MTTVASQDVFLLSEQRAVLVRLLDFEWDFTLGIDVELRAGKHTLVGKQIGTGNHEGRATISLSPYDEWRDATRILQDLLSSGMSIVLVPR